MTHRLSWTDELLRGPNCKHFYEINLKKYSIMRGGFKDKMKQKNRRVSRRRPLEMSKMHFGKFPKATI